MIIALLKENDPRISITPEEVITIKNWGVDFLIEEGYGKTLGWNIPDELLNKIKSREQILSQANIFITINPLSKTDIFITPENSVFVSRFSPYDNPNILSSLEQKEHTVYSLDMIPRITVAQSSDVLSSLASISGYKAVLLATQHFDRYLPMLTTAAGTIPPAKIMVIGTGVAGLQAIATAKRLGAVVSAFDTRVATKTEVMSLGAKFIEVEGATEDENAGGYAVEQSQNYQTRQKKEIFNNIVKNNIVITTAQIRGKPAPLLIDEKMVKAMIPGSVIIDLAASTGGNCALTKNQKTVQAYGVTIIGNSDLSQYVPYHASVLFSRNVVNFLKFMKRGETFDPLHQEHEVIKKSCIVYKGKRT